MANLRPYHHGNLETSILDLAVTEIEQIGYEALSLRELASAVGVSRGAPYRHFPNRLSFLEAVITRGLDIMNGQLAQAADAQTDSTEKVRAVFKQFLQFADEHPQLYRLCFASDMFISTEADDAFKLEAHRRFSFFADYVALRAPGLNRADVELLGVSCWAFLNGFAVLSTTARVHHIIDDAAREARCRELVVEQCLRLSIPPA